MNKILLIGIIVVMVVMVVMVVFLIAAMTRGTIHPAESIVWFLIPLAFWVFLVVAIWKKKTNIFHAQMEPKLAGSLYKRLKIFLLVAGISFAMTWLSAFLVYNVTRPEVIGNVFFFTIIFSCVLFFIATIGSLVIFLKGRRKTS